MRDDRYTSPELRTPVADGLYHFVIVTLDAHAAGPAQRVAGRLAQDFPGIAISVHAAAEWAENPAALARARARADVARANIIVANLIFLEEHLTQILPDMQARRDQLDACVGIISDPQVVRLTRMGDLDMSLPASGAMAFLKKLRGTKSPSGSSGERQMAMLRRLPKILRFIPGKAQDNRSRETDEIDRYCARVGFNRLAHMPDIDAIRRSRLKKKTLFEMADEQDIVTARAEYIRLAEALWRSVNGEGSTPEPLPDREIFELLGFD